ncbi:1981_t:CDS:2 [Funneliformis geosporum]|uniref:1739_t:CDS:1 n=1 Tax=Funneliformis geosporum TaxID=1117311 RepID=A0A9W4X2C7_9GLOM|nr:1981_t:CDS:2 [Funneliformis geosporum]CAI2181381.1 1739_t:CDS:2 [Funneliformis geosporum]
MLHWRSIELKLIMNYQQLYETVTKTIKHQPGTAISDALKNLLNYLNTKLENKSYYLLIKSYPTLSQILEAVEANGLED